LLFRTESLRPRLILIVGLALAPLALASIGQGVLRLDARQKESDEQLSDTAIYATHNEQMVFIYAKTFMVRLSTRPELTAGPDECHRLLKTSLIGATPFLNVALTDPTGNITCMGVVGSSTLNYNRFPWWSAMLARRDFTVGDKCYSSIVRQEILPLAFPIYDSNGRFTGALTVSLDLRWLNRRIATEKLPDKAFLLIVDRAGGVIASNRTVPRDLVKAVSQQGRSNFARAFVTKTAASGKWRWAAQPIGNNDNLVAFGMPETWLMGITRIYFFVDILLPFLMILFSWGAIWLGTEWLVIRWTTYLKRVSTAYGKGHFAIEMTDLAMAPEEFQLLGREMKSMAGSIQARDLKLGQALRQEKSLAREIHHRVKNNLQIVSSLISLYSRKVEEPSARLAMRQVGARVDALSLVHRLVERNGPYSLVSMKSLFSELAEQFRIQSEANGAPYRLQLEVDDHPLPVDVATPIALFTVEALSVGLFASTPDARQAKLSFLPDGPEQILLTIEDRALMDIVHDGTRGPSRILNALAEQIGGRTGVDEGTVGTCRLLLRIPTKPRVPLSGARFDEELGWGDDDNADVRPAFEDSPREGEASSAQSKQRA